MKPNIQTAGLCGRAADESPSAAGSNGSAVSPDKAVVQPSAPKVFVALTDDEIYICDHATD